jgi:hypothetical protein
MWLENSREYVSLVSRARIRSPRLSCGDWQLAWDLWLLYISHTCFELVGIEPSAGLENIFPSMFQTIAAIRCQCMLYLDDAWRISTKFEWGWLSLTCAFPSSTWSSDAENFAKFVILYANLIFLHAWMTTLRLPSDDKWISFLRIPCRGIKAHFWHKYFRSQLV